MQDSLVVGGCLHWAAPACPEVVRQRRFCSPPCPAGAPDKLRHKTPAALGYKHAMDSKPDHILIVDDDPDTRRLLTLSLAWAGHEIVEADSGEDAWAQLQRDPVRLIITDWMMPGMDGAALIKCIRSSGD